MNLPFLGPKKEIEYFLTLILSLGEIRGILFEKSEKGLFVLGTKKVELEESIESLSVEKLIEVSDIVISDSEKNLPAGAEFRKTIFVVPHAWVVEGKIIKEFLLRLKTLCEALSLTPIGFIVSIEAVAALLHRKEGVAVTAVFVEIGKKHITLSIVKNGSVTYIADEEIKQDEIASVEEILLTQDVAEVLPSKIILLNFDKAKKLEQVFTTHQWSKKLHFLHIPKVEVLGSDIESEAVISGVAAKMGFSGVGWEQEEENINDVGSEKEVSIKFNGERVGFFQDKDVLEEKRGIETVVQEAKIEPYEDSREVEFNSQKENMMDKIPKINLSLFKDFMSSLLSGKKSIWYPLIAVIVLIAITFGYYFLFEKVEVVMVLDKQEVKKDLIIEFSENKETSAEDSVIHVSVKQIEKNGKEEKAATGKKETGEKTKGEVTILSSINKETIIEKGTILTSSNSLKFLIDSDTKVASSSGISDIKNAKGKVTAQEIGKEYNLPSGTKFTVSGFDKSSLEAKNDSAFSGGSKKEIKVVSQDDIDSLASKTVSNLSKKAIEDAVSQKGEDEEILPDPLGYEFNEKIFSKDEGEETENVTLSAAVIFDVGYYNNEDIAKIASEISGDGISDRYNYSGKDSKVVVEDIEENDGQITGKVSFTSVFLPEIKTADLSQKIKGKSAQKARDLISSDGVADVQIVYSRTLPIFPKILPFNKSNIIITTKTE